MRVCLVASILLLTQCYNDTKWKLNCPATCYNGPLGTRNVGQCREGIPECDKEQRVLRCVGEVHPTKEVCNSKDDDCDGFRDEGIPVNIIPCLSVGVCRGTVHSACDYGEYQCIWPINYEDPEVSCDGLDNNCDGVVDNVDTNGAFCFDHPEWWRATHPPCQVGIISCGGCAGQVLPGVEVCGDGIDNDCDGYPANRIVGWLDVVIMMDPSGSMCPFIATIVSAVVDYITTMQNQNIRWAVVNISWQGPLYYEVVQDFSDAATTISTINASTCTGAGFEVGLDVLYELCERRLLDWQNSGVLIGFTDEPLIGLISRTPMEYIDSCVANDITPNYWARHRLPIQEIVEGAGGSYYTISTNVPNLEEQLQLTITQCD